MIEIRNLSKSFGDVKVLDNLSIDLPMGRVIAVLGKMAPVKLLFLELWRT